MDIQPLLTKWHIRMSYEEILARWRESHRAYHTEEHLEDLLQQIVALPMDAYMTQKKREKLILAALFHDIVYDPRRNDNEECSAQLLLKHAPDSPDIQHIVEIIRDTKTHKARSGLSEIFCQMDMSVVKKPLPDLVRWETGIRMEYKHVPRFLYVIARIRFLKQMIDRYPDNKEALINLIRIITPVFFHAFVCLL